MDRVTCGRCGRPCAPRAPRCLGCGAPIAKPARPAVAPPLPAPGGNVLPLLEMVCVFALLIGGVAWGWKRGWLVRSDGAPAPDAQARSGPASPPIAPTPTLDYALAVAPAPSTGPLLAEGPSAPQPAAARPVRVDSHPGWLVGASGVGQALAEQKRSGCPVLLYFWADWCPYCKEFDQAVLPDAEVDRAIAPAVKARLEPEKGSAEKALADQYGAHGYPSLFLIPAPGTRPMSLPSGISKGSPARPAEFSAAFRGQLAYAWGLAAKQAFDAGRYDDAIAYADQLVAYDPSFDQGYGYEIRAVAFRRKNEVPDALRDYDLACAAGRSHDCFTH